MFLISICVVVFVSDSFLLLLSITCPNILLCLSILPLVDTKAISNCLLLRVKLLWTFVDTSLCGCMLSLFFGEYLRVGSRVVGESPVYFIRCGLTFPKQLYQFTFLSILFALHPHECLALSIIFILAILKSDWLWFEFARP